MTIRLEDSRRHQLVERLRALAREDFEEEMSAFRAERILDFFLDALGPHIYNQAVQDARKFMQDKLDDLEGEVYEPEGA